MATTIREYVAERGITCLMHFARTSSLDSILARGLLTRDILVQGGFKAFNDQLRLDGTHAVCLSIEFPNYKMFHGVKKDNPNETWIIVVVSPAVLWELDCAFCVANAASNGVTAIAIAQRRGLAAMQAMYADWPTKVRAELNIPNSYPTNPQAEVLVLQNIPPSYIMGLYVLNEAARQAVNARCPSLDVRVDAGKFRWRRDYEHWKPQA